MTQDNSSLGTRWVLFDDEQISHRQLTLDLSLKVSRRKEWICLIVGTLFFVVVGTMDKSVPSWVGGLLVILGIAMYLWVVLCNIENWISKRKSDRLYDKLKIECCKYDGDDCRVNADKLKEITDKYRQRLNEGYFKRALYLFYRDYLNSIISDCRISNKENDELQRVEELLNLDKELLKKVKLCAFNKVYLTAVKDKILTREEEGDILRVKDVLSLSDNDVSEELETLNLLREARKICEEHLNPINVNFSLNKGELCYHQTKGRIVKEKTLRSYQEEGVRHAIKGLVKEKEGDLYLTSQRIIIVGEGVYSIKLDKIFNIKTDIDDNTISLDIEDRKSSLILTVPDSLIFSAKLNKLKMNNKETV